MIKIDSTQIKKRIHNFWSNVHFHPTDAIEDIWGKRILENISKDNIAKYVRIYAMLEDVVSLDDNENIMMDFELTDKRIDYMIEKGFNLLICMNFMPAAISSNKTQVSFFKRYKGKRINTSKPCDYKLWQEVCRLYAMHLVERYGEEIVSQWYFHCWNEPDLEEYWMTGCDDSTERFDGYCKLYDHFAEGFSAVSESLKIGGPSVAFDVDFIRNFIIHTKSGTNYANGKTGTKFDFFSIHTYGQTPADMQINCTMTPKHTLDKVLYYREIVKECGYNDIEIIVDEWEACSLGFENELKYPSLIYRNNEHFSAFYFSLIDCYINNNADISKMMICLSGQHSLTKDFEGYRNFFTLSGFKKPIYNAYALGAMLGENLLSFASDENVGCIPTMNDNGEICIALYNISFNLTKKAETRNVKLNVKLKSGNYIISHYRIDKENCNSYSAWCRFGKTQNINQEQREAVEQAGNLKLWYPQERINADNYMTDIVMTEDAVSFIKISPVK